MSEIHTRNFSGDRHQLPYNQDHDGPLQNTVRLEQLMYSNPFLFLNRFPVAKQTIKSMHKFVSNQTKTHTITEKKPRHYKSSSCLTTKKVDLQEDVHIIYGELVPLFSFTIEINN